MFISDNLRDRIITFSLGSCLGVTIFDPILKVGGIIHCMLPNSKLNEEKAKDRPEMFVNTGLTLMLQEFFNAGSSRRDLIIKLAGAAAVLNDNQFFKVGERNYQCALKFFEKNKLDIAAEDVLGTDSRTLSLYMATGTTTIRSYGRETVL